MCGIVGYVGNRDAVPILLDGLQRLEYRGYDSAGLAIFSGEGVCVRKRVGKLGELAQSLRENPIAGTGGVGHTRWATHGRPSEENSHPHSDGAGMIHVVHNGIIENYHTLKDQLQIEGHQFHSQTDTEVLAHLIGQHYRGDLAHAVREALQMVEGAYALGIICDKEPGRLVAARSGSPLILGLGEGENFIASDVPAILNHTRKIIYLGEKEVASISAESVEITDLEGRPVTRDISRIDWDASAAEKSGYPHFMLKEIHEQPQVINNTLRGRFDEDGVVELRDIGISDDDLRNARKILITACGTAYHAGLVGRLLLERIARVPVEVDLASEFRYRDPVIDEGTIVMAVTQSGETADTLAGIREAKRRGARVLSICNVVGSSIARESDGVIYQNAGPEIGVASTKAYTSQIVAFALFTVYLGQLRRSVSREEAMQMSAEIRDLPSKMRQALEQDGAIFESRDRYYLAESALFLGRGYNYPSALEGALKLKEISYIHAEGYAAGEMKHGPIALVDHSLPAICICVQSEVYDKMLSNIQEIRARQGSVLAIATEGDREIARHADEVVYVPAAPEYLSPVLTALPLQLLAYHIATRRGCDVDQPRNLAKSVTVE